MKRDKNFTPLSKLHAKLSLIVEKNSSFIYIKTPRNYILSKSESVYYHWKTVNSH